MDASLEEEIARLRGGTIGEVVARFVELFRYEARSTHRNHLIRRIAWKLQALASGDIPQAAVAHALAIADESELRGKGGISKPRLCPRPNRKKRVEVDLRVPAAHTEISREYRGRNIVVTVLEKGFAYEGQPYASLSAVARVVTGTRWNGLVFFGLAKRKVKKMRKQDRKLTPSSGKKRRKPEVAHAA